MNGLFGFFFLIVVATADECNCHTWHNVTAYKGEWKATITSLHESATFVQPHSWKHENCTVLEQPRGHFNITPTSVQTFGFKFGQGTDFDIMYALTLVRTDKVLKSSPQLPRTQMGCVFVIGAAGPAMPDVRAENYNGAICMWNRVPGVGENYYVDFAREV